MQVLEALKKSNKEFFGVYALQLQLKDQISLYNYLVSQYAQKQFSEMEKIPSENPQNFNQSSANENNHIELRSVQTSFDLRVMPEFKPTG